jgi:formylmethanofuran dehydrogenase subunit E
VSLPSASNSVYSILDDDDEQKKDFLKHRASNEKQSRNQCSVHNKKLDFVHTSTPHKINSYYSCDENFDEEKSLKNSVMNRCWCEFLEVVTAVIGWSEDVW